MRKTILTLLLFCSAAVHAQLLPTYVRNALDTNDNPTAMRVVTNAVGGILQRGSNVISGSFQANGPVVHNDQTDFVGPVLFDSLADGILVVNGAVSATLPYNPALTLPGAVTAAGFRNTVTNATGTAVTVDWNGPSIVRLDLTGATAIELTNVPTAGSASRRLQLIVSATTDVPATTISQVDPRQVMWVDGGPYLLGTFTNVLNILFDGTNFLGSSAQIVFTGSGFPAASNSPSLFNLRALGSFYMSQNTNSRIVISNSSATGVGVWHLEGTNGTGGWKSMVSVNLTNGNFATPGFSLVSLSGGALDLNAAGTFRMPGSASVDSAGRIFTAGTLSTWNTAVTQTSNQLMVLNVTAGRRGLRVVNNVPTNTVGVVASFADSRGDVLTVETNGVGTRGTNPPVAFTTTGYTNTLSVNVQVSLLGTALTVTKFETNGTQLFSWGAVTGPVRESLKPNQWITTSGTLTSNNVEPW